MELDDAFTKAALYETCVKSKILRNIDLDNVDTQTLRGLVNKYNALSLREFPIVITKVLVKFGLTFATEKMPRLRTYINPDNISVQIETDELAYLERTQSKFQPNIYMIVAKNIAVGVLGTSIQSLRELIAKTVDPNKSDESITETNTRNEVSEQSSRYKVNKIQVNSVQQTIPEITTPKRFTNFADTFKSPIDAPTTPSVKRVTEQAVSVESVREKKRIDAAEKRQYQRDAVHSLHRAEIHATTTDSGADAEEEEDAFDSVSVASERTVRQPEITDTDAADVVNRFIKQQQSPPPPPPSTSPTHQQPPLSNNEELTRPLRSINANEFMSIIETNYTNLLNGEKDAAAYKHTPDEDTVKKDAAYKPTPDDDHEQRYEDDDDDDGLRLDDGKHRYAPTPKRPPSVASSVNLTFDDDDGEDDDM